jgi:hypothetical protein
MVFSNGSRPRAIAENGVSPTKNRYDSAVFAAKSLIPL